MVDWKTRRNSLFYRDVIYLFNPFQRLFAVKLRGSTQTLVGIWTGRCWERGMVLTPSPHKNKRPSRIGCIVLFQKNKSGILNQKVVWLMPLTPKPTRCFKPPSFGPSSRLKLNFSHQSHPQDFWKKTSRGADLSKTGFMDFATDLFWCCSFFFPGLFLLMDNRWFKPWPFLSPIVGGHLGHVFRHPKKLTKNWQVKISPIFSIRKKGGNFFRLPRNGMFTAFSVCLLESGKKFRCTTAWTRGQQELWRKVGCFCGSVFVHLFSTFFNEASFCAFLLEFFQWNLRDVSKYYNLYIIYRSSSSYCPDGFATINLKECVHSSGLFLSFQSTNFGIYRRWSHDDH